MVQLKTAGVGVGSANDDIAITIVIPTLPEGPEVLASLTVGQQRRVVRL